jgi:molybdopterin/thiamine biosynthesis adenylyltransferase
MTPDERERYKRQLMSAGFTDEHQERLRSSTVLLAGIGGLGGALAYGLAAAGVGKIKLIHAGRLTESNLNRQTLMQESALGESRVFVAKRRLEAFSRFVTVEAHDADVTEAVLHPLMEGVDLVIDARHNFPERKTLNAVAMAHATALLFAAMDDLAAQMALFRPSVTGCLACLYPDDPPEWDPFGFAVFGALAHAVGAMAALEAIKYLSGFGRLADRLVTMNGADYRTATYRLRPDPACPVCRNAVAGITTHRTGDHR